MLRLREQARCRIAELEAAGNLKEAGYWAHDLRHIEETIAKYGYDRDAKGS